MMLQNKVPLLRGHHRNVCTIRLGDRIFSRAKGHHDANDNQISEKIRGKGHHRTDDNQISKKILRKGHHDANDNQISGKTPEKGHHLMFGHMVVLHAENLTRLIFHVPSQYLFGNIRITTLV